MKLNGNQPSAAETMKSIDNNHLLQIQEIKIDLHKSGEQEKYSEHDVNKVFHVKRVSRQYPPVNRYLVRDAICRKCATASLAIIIGLCYVGNWRDHFLVATYEHMSLNATPTNPFSVIGVDFTRPVKYLQWKSKKEQQMYIVIYSCSLTRAVFLELLPRLETGEFIESLKPLIARRGRLTKIYSDNGRTFIAAANWLKKVHKDERLNTLSLNI